MGGRVVDQTRKMPPTLVVARGSMHLQARILDTRTPSTMGSWVTFVQRVGGFMFWRGPSCAILSMGMMGQRVSKGTWTYVMGRGIVRRSHTHFKYRLTCSLFCFPFLFFFKVFNLFLNGVCASVCTSV